ncbi:hypothetical protein [Peribacillus frigoritolerans]|uniref:hypothetical protein n=1 Tax=Peribacillus frigoritolerans TaxID=450367 RepID=UPI0032E47CA3
MKLVQILEFGVNTREFGSFTREFGANTREFGAFTREFGTNTREFGVITREIGTNILVRSKYSLVWVIYS